MQSWNTRTKLEISLDTARCRMGGRGTSYGCGAPYIFSI